MGDETDKQHGIAAHDQRQTIVTCVACKASDMRPFDKLKCVGRPTDRVHRVWCKFEHTIKDEVTALEKDIAPVPAVILDNAVRFRFDPEIERD